MSKEHGCETCGFRAKYDAKPNSFLGKFWRWHAGWCPGWKAYMTDLPTEKRVELANRYNMPKWK